MASEESVTEQFNFLGIEVKEEILNKCVNLCNRYNIDPETFVEQWMAFSLSQLNGAAPTLDSLVMLERKEFAKREAASGVPQEVKHSRTSLTVYGVPGEEQSDIGVLGNYMSTATTPKKIKSEPTVNQSELRPATYSPSIGHSDKYVSRNNAGAIVHSFGEESLLDKLSNPSDLNVQSLNIAQISNDDGDVYTKAMYGFELLHEKASAYDRHIRYLSQCIMKKHGISESSSVKCKSQVEVAVCGRVECDADARLNNKCVILQGTWQESLSQAVPVDLDSCQQYSLFPGQVVVMRGVNPRGDKFVAREVLSDASQPIPDHAADIINKLSGTLTMLVSAGPYTTSDNMTYEPLKDLIAYINTNRPHLVLMTGPFMDQDHAKVRDNSMAETYKSFFEKLIDTFGDVANTSPNTKFYIVSSSRDAFHMNIYPTPPYYSRKKHPNIHFVPDPSTLNLNGVIVGVTSSDVLMQISQEEISQGVGGDKLSRVASHVISQQCYSPLWPPLGSVDAALWSAHAQLPVTPHLLVLPSNFRYFVKEVNGCVVVNPEHLTKGTGGGTFARLSIMPIDQQPLHRGIAAQIVRI